MVALIVLPFVLLLCIGVWVAIKLNDGGPLFHMASRIGRGGRIFKMYKFRSMIVNAPDLRMEDGSTYNSADDPRVTKVGRFLRKTSLDELPQLLNVLIGDMALIGPRPLLPIYLRLYTPEQARRHEVRPGISGWAQVHGRNHCKLSEKFALDVWYVDHCTIGTDLKIIWMTVMNVLKRSDVGEGASDMKDIDDLGFSEKIAMMNK